MANYSQPPYGLPFAAPPQQFYPQQAATSPPEVQPPIMPDGLPYPGLNLQQFAQNSQQQQYPFWPPPPLSTSNTYQNMPYPPPPFMAQNGVIPPPPVPPNFPFSPVPQLPFQNAAAPTPPPAQPHAPFQQTQPHAPLTNDRTAEVMDTDKEEGEVSEGDRVSQPPAIKGKAKAQPEPPRSVPNGQGDERANTSGTPVSNLSIQRQAILPASQSSQETLPANEMASLSKQRAAAAEFVRLLHENSVGYSMLASEGLDTPLLESLYRGLDLPVHALPGRVSDGLTAPPSNATTNSPSLASHSASTARSAQVSTAIKINVAPTQLAKKVPSPIEPAPAKDRGSYVAALAAARAKNAALAAASKGASPTAVQAPTKAAPSQITSPPVHPTTKAPAAAVQPSANGGRTAEPDPEKSRKSELLRQKLEAFKAKQALKKQDPASGAATPSVITDSGPPQASIVQTVQPTQASQAPQTPTFSGIPGLFMGTSVSNGVVQTQKLQRSPPSSINNTRKRPVAADFDDVATARSQGPAFTRPLGQSPHEHDNERMILEVSDGESEDSDNQDMDLDNEEVLSAKRKGVSTPDARPFGQLRYPMFQDFPHSASTFPFSPGAHTPSMQTPNALTYKQLAQTENEIARLKREIELKSKIGGKTTAIKNISKMPSRAIQSKQNEHATSSTAKALDPHGLRNVPAFGQDIDSQRQSEIEAELASLESKIENAKAKEIELLQQVAVTKAAQDKYLQTRASLLKQLEITQKNPEPELHSSVQIGPIEAQQNKAQALVAEPRVDVVPDTDQVMVDTPGISHSTDAQGKNPLCSEDANTNETIVGTDSKASQPAFSSGQLPGIAISSEDSVLSIDIPIPGHDPRPAHGLDVVGASPKVNGEIGESTAAVTPAADDDDFYSPEPEVGPNSKQPREIQNPPPAANSPSSEGEVEMLESPQSEEEEYEPIEPVVPATLVACPEDDAMEIANSSTSSSEASTTDDEEEAYEPPDITAEATNLSNDAIALAPIPDAQVMPINKSDALDRSMLSSEDSDSDDSSSAAPTAAFISSNNAKSDSVGLADDVPPGKQLQTVPAAQIISTEQGSHAGIESFAFAPYESPLRIFKSYRYHKDFINEVSGRFQSMTYSHQIDPMKPICRFEADGGTCNDPQCDGQHFGAMGITGDKILVQLGTANPGKTTQARQQYSEGLRGVLKELRQNSIKDTNKIADEIAKYRRKFLDDNTRVVNL